MNRPKLSIKKILFTILWLFIGVSGVVLLVAAVRSKNEKICKGIEIEISGVSNNFFIDKADVLSIVKNFAGGIPKGKTLNAFNLGAIESNLEKNVWIKNAELFFDNNDLLRVSVDEREPVARIFSKSGASFYIDSSLMVLPLSEKFSARLPVFTGFEHNPGFLSKADTVLLTSMKELSLALQADSFLMAMIDQVDITAQNNFELIPKIGNQLIVFGNAEDVSEKLNKLRLFYKSVITTAGWSKYSVINLQYKNQVVAKIKDAADKSSDSLRALQIMQIIAERSARQAADSMQFFTQTIERPTTDSTMIQQSVQREDEPEQATGNIEMPAAASTNPGNKIVQPLKQDFKNTAAPKKIPVVKPPVQKPKAVMN